MRTVLVTGPGGAGRTTLASATALAATRRGSRVLLLSTDPGDLLGVPLTPSPVRVTDGLWAARVDAAAHFRDELLTLQKRVGGALDLLGARELDGDELTELPGSEQFALLHALRRYGAPDTGGDTDWDVLVVDMPPVRETLAVLALPEQLRRYLRRLLPRERQAARALRPMMAQLAGLPMPAEWLYETAAHRDSELAAVQSLIEAPQTSLRLVAEPGPAGQEALRLARAGAALYGLRVDTLVANRVLPAGQAGPWLTHLVSQQRACLDSWRAETRPGTELRLAAHLGRDPRGLDDLTLLGTGSGTDGHSYSGTGSGTAVHSGSGPESGGLGVDTDERVPGDPRWVEDRLAEDGLLVWCIPLPGARKSELSLVRRDDELILTVGPFRRIALLPSALRRCTVSGAALTDGVLRVRFTPDAALWPRTD